MGAAQSSQTYDPQERLASKLASGQPCLLAFMSPHCGLCASLRPSLEQACSSANGPPLQVAMLNTQLDKEWAPEMLAYNIETVPCFVLVDAEGRAVCKTPPPQSRQQMEAALAEMLEHVGGRLEKG